MISQLISHIKRNAFLYSLARWLYNRIGLARLLIGEWSIGEIKSEYEKVKSTQLIKNRPLFLDRYVEAKRFFNVSDFYLFSYFIKHGFPWTPRFKKNLDSFFKEKLTKRELKNAYSKAAFHYTLRLLLAYEKYSIILPSLDFMIGHHPKDLSEWKVLDYGCGISDIGLLFASLGAEVTICDLDDKKLEFTCWRFEKRGLKPEVIKVNDTEMFPPLREQEYDIIIAAEIFEHVRSPLQLLKNFTYSLKPGGYLFDSMGGSFKRAIKGDHLCEAIIEGNSPEYINYHKKHYQQVSPEGNLKCLFRKLVPSTHAVSSVKGS